MKANSAILFEKSSLFLQKYKKKPVWEKNLLRILKQKKVKENEKIDSLFLYRGFFLLDCFFGRLIFFMFNFP